MVLIILLHVIVMETVVPMRTDDTDNCDTDDGGDIRVRTLISVYSMFNKFSCLLVSFFV